MATFLTPAPRSHAAESILKKGDRIVFLGDSITQAGAGATGYITLVRKAIDDKLAGLEIKVIGAGVSGHKVPDLEARLERDVLRKKPTIVVIYIGINDVWHSQNGRGTSKKDYEQGLRRLITRINAVGARVILCTPSVIGEKQDLSNTLDGMLEEYSALSRKVAVDAKSQLLDLRENFLTYLKKHNPQNAEKNILTTDGVHLNVQGNRFVADRMLEALGVGGRSLGLVRHVVLFKFKNDVTPAQVEEVVVAFAALPKKIKHIVDFEYGTDVSVENRAAGFTHCFLVTFREEQGRDAYLPHPAHQAFVKLVGPRIENVLVFDYHARQ